MSLKIFSSTAYFFPTVCSLTKSRICKQKAEIQDNYLSFYAKLYEVVGGGGDAGGCGVIVVGFNYFIQ